jgi:hypothetical protein
VGFRLVLLLMVGLGIQIVGGPSKTHSILLVSSMVLIAAFLFANRGRAGFPLVLVGLVLNILVIAANGAMPVSPSAARATGADAADLVAADLRHESAAPDTNLGFLADVIPLGGKVFSIGDLFLLCGLLWFLAASVNDVLGKSNEIGMRELQ